MITVHTLIPLLLSCGALCSAQSGEVVHGRVLRAGNAQLSIRTADGRPRVFSVRAGAVVTLNGMRTRLEALRPGYAVIVTTSVGHLAVRVEGKSYGYNPGNDGDGGPQANAGGNDPPLVCRCRCRRLVRWRLVPCRVGRARPCRGQ